MAPPVLTKPELTKPDLPPPVLPPVPPTAGSWGAGRPYHPAARRPAALRWLTGADWRPALRVVVAPTVVLLLAALIAAVPESDLYFGPYGAPSFGKRFASSLAMALAALGAPYRLGLESVVGETSSVFRALPMTVTGLWLFALWLGLRVGARRRQQRTGEQQTRRQAAGEAVRTAVAAAVVAVLLGLAGGLRWQPGGEPYGPDPSEDPLFGRTTSTASAGWPEAVAWAALLAGLLAFAVHGTDALRWAAWRNRAVRGWAVAGLAAGRALAVSVALASGVGFVLVAVRVDGDVTGAAVAFLPNLGLLLLGVGSGATFRASSTAVPGAGADVERGVRDAQDYSFFDPNTAGTDWRWSALLALVSAAVLGWTAYRRRLDRADRLRLAVVYAVGLSLLTLLSGTVVSTGTGYRGVRMSGFDDAFGLVPWTLLVASAVWAAVGALAVPALLAARDRRPEPPADRGAGESGADAGARSVVRPGAEAVGPTPMPLEVVGSEDGRRPARPEPEDGGPVDPTVWSRRP
ncbi:hypothetical protein ACIQ9P_15415 [Kitasatospora sp. NPDC094019]|uniref:hypothetical protein n=1 Tax=Kitasatospora sp. NPDC094019 TaxID=3364091 RepID=UPI003802FD31